MPVTARLSERFYQQFGDEITNELVDWFNAVDTTYRSDLREANEANFVRFDAKLEQRMAQLESAMIGRLAIIETRLRDETRGGLAALEGRMAERLGGVENRLGTVEARLSDLDRRLAETRADGIKWAFVFWATTLLAILGLYK